MKRTLSIIAAMFVAAMAYSQTPELRPEVFDLIDLDRRGMENVKALHQNGQDAEAAAAAAAAANAAKAESAAAAAAVVAEC